MGITRANLIVKVKSELGPLDFNTSTTDSAGAGNLYHYAINDAGAHAQITTTDVYLANATDNEVRILSLGTQYYFIKSIIKKKLSEPRVDHDNVSRDTFNRLMEFLRFIRKDFLDAISGEDVPPEVVRPAESIQTWGSPSDGASMRSSEKNNFQRSSGEFYITDMGEDLTDYNDDGE